MNRRHLATAQPAHLGVCLCDRRVQLDTYRIGFCPPDHPAHPSDPSHANPSIEFDGRHLLAETETQFKNEKWFSSKSGKIGFLLCKTVSALKQPF